MKIKTALKIKTQIWCFNYAVLIGMGKILLFYKEWQNGKIVLQA